MIINDCKKIIDSMTMNEKRYFKVFINKNIFGTQNKYLIIFDLFNNNTHVNEDLIIEETEKHNFSSKNTSYDINYLIKIILRSLNEFHNEKTISLKFINYIKSIEILFYKGLFDECLKLISKAKKLNLKNENEELTLELLNWEKKCMGYSKGFYSAMSINEKIDTYFDHIREKKEITDLYYQSYYLKNNIGKIPLNDLLEGVKTIEKSSAFKKTMSSLHSIQSKIYHFLIRANCSNIKNETEKELINLEQTIEVFDKNSFYKEENPLDYISIYIRIIDIYKNSDDFTFYKKIEALRNFENILDLQKNVALERIFFHTYQAELEFLIFNDKISDALELMQIIDKNLKENKFTIEPYYFVEMYYQFACLYLANNNLSKSLKFINTILNEFIIEDRPKTFVKTEILNLIIHFELKNYKLVINKYSTLKKKYQKSFNLNEIEKKLLNTILKLATNPYGLHERVAFQKLRKKIEKIETIDKNTSNKIYLNYINKKTN
jgi:hypothetical protein